MHEGPFSETIQIFNHRCGRKQLTLQVLPVTQTCQPPPQLCNRISLASVHAVAGLMLIPINSSCDGAGGLPEWAIVELQGDIKRRPEARDGPDGELDVGTLCTSVRTLWLC